jgi:CDP-diacylglycerol--glycerol-3-phosphate 3-phosphatidyltransferase
MLVYYASVNRFGYIVLTAVAMTGSVMVSYVRARSENEIPKCKVGFLERPERIVLLIIGTLFNRMTAVLWVIAVLSNLTVVHRIVHTWKETTRIGQSPAEAPAAQGAKAKSSGGLQQNVRSA